MGRSAVTKQSCASVGLVGTVWERCTAGDLPDGGTEVLWLSLCEQQHSEMCHWIQKHLCKLPAVCVFWRAAEEHAAMKITSAGG